MPGILLPRTWRFDPTIYAPARYKRACRYEAFVPEELARLTITLDGGVVGVISEAEHAIRDLNERGGPALRSLARLLLRTESIASSKIEGMQLGVRELARAEARLETGERVSGAAAEILANVDAMSLAVEEAALARRISKADIVAIHQRLMARAENRRIAGRVRTQQNWIGGNDHNPCGADFVPPPPEELARLLDDLCEAINDDRLPPIVQAALVHAQFETIHPFEDGNGRTGRALIHVVLRRRGVAPRYVPPISVVLARAKARYIGGLTAFRGDGVQHWIEYFAGAAAESARLGDDYLAAVDALRARWRIQLGALEPAPRSGAAAWALVDVLPAHPTITAAVAAEAVQRSRPQTYQAIEQLVQAGVLVPLSASRRNRAWEASGLLELVEELEGGHRPGPARARSAPLVDQ